MIKPHCFFGRFSSGRNMEPVPFLQNRNMHSNHDKNQNRGIRKAVPRNE